MAATGKGTVVAEVQYRWKVGDLASKGSGDSQPAPRIYGVNGAVF